MASELIVAAREYLAAGLPVIALDGKAPNPAVHRHGLLQPITGVPETEEDERLLAWAFHPEKMGGYGTQGRTTGIGIPIPQNMCVADIDSDEAADVYTHWVGELPETPVARTRHGIHVWYLAPGFASSIWVGPLLLRGPGSYVVVPPSTHPEGGAYEWIRPLVGPLGIGPIDWLPDGLLRAIETAKQVVALAHPPRDPDAEHFHGRLEIVDGRLTYVPTVEVQVEMVVTAPRGLRNHTLFVAASQACENGVDYEVAETLLGEAGAEAGLNPREVRTTIRSAYRRQAKGRA